MIQLDRSSLILTTYRTGSTALCSQLQDSGYHNHDEAFTWGKNAFDFTEAVRNIDYKFVVKVMPDQLNDSIIAYLNRLIKTNHVQVIRLYRRDIVAQIASIYIAKKTKNWHVTDREDTTQQQIAIDDRFLAETVHNMLSMSYNLTQLPIGIDTQLVYENLDLSNSQYKVNPKPNNYNTILDKIQTIIHNNTDLTNQYSTFYSWYE